MLLEREGRRGGALRSEMRSSMRVRVYDRIFAEAAKSLLALQNNGQKLFHTCSTIKSSRGKAAVQTQAQAMAGQAGESGKMMPTDTCRSV